MKSRKEEEKLFDALQDFTSKENWDEFFKLRGDKPFEWYGDWYTLEEPLLSTCSVALADGKSPDILIPGCGNSEISEKLYDAGFTGIINIDFSKIVIQSMLRKHLRSRPHMVWRLMDMTHMQFVDSSFDVVIDKGSLDALMEPELGPKLGIQFLSEVKRVLRCGGRYVCVSLAQTHVIELLLSKFRFGWKVSIDVIKQNADSSVSSYHPFLITAIKEGSNTLHSITGPAEATTSTYSRSQVQGLLNVVSKEDNFRRQHTAGEDLLYSLEELQIGAKGDIRNLVPGRRTCSILSEPGISSFTYRAVIMDSHQHFGPFTYDCGAFIVPKVRAQDWLFSSEEGQWQIVESAKAGRLVMIFLDDSHDGVDMASLQKDLSPLVEGLAPAHPNKGRRIPFMMAGDDVAARTVVEEVNSSFTGKIIVEDVILKNDKDAGKFASSKEQMVLRRLIFERNHNLVQSEAVLKIKNSSRSDLRKNHKGKISSSSMLQGSRNNFIVDHSCLSNLYHAGIIAGLGLIVSELEHSVHQQNMAKALVIGLGAGLLPMFLHKAMSFLHVEAVELDPAVADLARSFFGFVEDAQMKVRIGDGVQVISELAGALKLASVNNSLTADPQTTTPKFPSEQVKENPDERKSVVTQKMHIIIVDVDSDDTSSGLTCPHPSFLEESFLQAAKESLDGGGIFILNLVSRSKAIHEMVISRMQKVFKMLFGLEIEEDVNKVLFALPAEVKLKRQNEISAMDKLEKLMSNSGILKNNRTIKDYARKIRALTS